MRGNACHEGGVREMAPWWNGATLCYVPVRPGAAGSTTQAACAMPHHMRGGNGAVPKSKSRALMGMATSD